MSRRPTAARPRVDKHWLPRCTRVMVHRSLGPERAELDLVDPDSGVVVYTTPICTFFQCSTSLPVATAHAVRRARSFARRHGLEVQG